MKVIFGTNREWEIGHRYVNYPISNKYRRNNRITFTVLREATVHEYIKQLQNDGASRTRPIPIGARFYQVEME